MSRSPEAGNEQQVDNRENSESLEFPPVATDSVQAQNRAAFVAGFRDSTQLGSRQREDEGEEDLEGVGSLEAGFQSLSVLDSSGRGRGRGYRSNSVYSEPAFRPWTPPSVSYPPAESYAMRMPPGQMPMQWMPYPPPHPGMGYGMYGEPRQQLYYDSRMPGAPAFQPGFFPQQHLQPPMHAPFPGQRFGAPMMQGAYLFQPQQQGPPLRQKPPKPYKTVQQSPEAYDFSVEEAEQQPDTCRKTLMLRNIPNKYSIHMLLEMLDNCHGRGPGELVYDFCYLPIDFKNRCNLGYAFVNFVDAKSALECYRTFHEKRWNDFNSKKVCEVKYGRVQGREALIEHFKNSKFPSNDIDSLPLLFEQVAKDDGSKEICSLPMHSKPPS